MGIVIRGFVVRGIVVRVHLDRDRREMRHVDRIGDGG
jgi:hypothetical protein